MRDLLTGLMATLVLMLSLPAAAGAASAADAPVVLLHGLARTARSMADLEQALAARGYQVCNIDYPSRQQPVEVLARDSVLPAVRACAGEAERVDFVTHSMGGIIVRQLRRAHPDLAIGRVVMIAPPNGGSEVVDALGDWRLFGLINGPAGRQLGTGEAALPRALGPADFELGVIAGTRSINLLLSWLIPGDDDGKVAVEKAHLEGAADFLQVPRTHPFIMSAPEVIEQTLHFLAHGHFEQNDRRAP